MLHAFTPGVSLFSLFSPVGARVGGEEWIRKNVPFCLWIYFAIG